MRVHTIHLFVSRASLFMLPSDLFSLLPWDLSLSIFSFLSESSLSSTSSVNALLFVLSQDDYLWKAQCRRRWSTLFHHGQRLLSVSSSPTSTDSFPGWKSLYISAELDLCRSFLSLQELTSHRWRFRFRADWLAHTNSESITLFPRFTGEHVYTESTLNTSMAWRWIDRDRTETGEDSHTQTEYERRGLLDRQRIQHIRDTLHTHKAREGEARRRSERLKRRQRQRERETQASSASRRSRYVEAFEHEVESTDDDETNSTALPLSPSSALLQPSLPPYRYPIGFPFVRLSRLQRVDLRKERNLQVHHYPPLYIQRLSNGQWQMTNDYVVLRSMDDDHEENKESAEDANRLIEWLQGMLHDDLDEDISVEDDDEDMQMAILESNRERDRQRQREEEEDEDDPHASDSELYADSGESDDRDDDEAEEMIQFSSRHGFPYHLHSDTMDPD